MRPEMLPRTNDRATAGFWGVEDVDERFRNVTAAIDSNILT
jgi:hypothetical protein